MESRGRANNNCSHSQSFLLGKGLAAFGRGRMVEAVIEISQAGQRDQQRQKPLPRLALFCARGGGNGGRLAGLVHLLRSGPNCS